MKQAILHSKLFQRGLISATAMVLVAQFSSLAYGMVAGAPQANSLGIGLGVIGAALLLAALFLSIVQSREAHARERHRG